MSAQLVVVALGGNAIAPPGGDLSLDTERRLIASTANELAAVAAGGPSLLVVHGNGPQVGRLVAFDPDLGQLDVRVAQTQGELGYLLAEALERRLHGPCAALVTRVLVHATDPAFARPSKPVGGVLSTPPPDIACVRTPDGHGWRRVVASPRPTGVVEERAIALLLAQGYHVVAGGGGGVPLVEAPGGHAPVSAVVDKDWVAAHLAIALDATVLLFVTDVSHAFDDFARARVPIERMTAAEARVRLQKGVFAEGSMGPKIGSAVAYVEACRRPAVVTTPGQVEAALAGMAGTRITLEESA